jgi:hypothetical protein
MRFDTAKVDGMCASCFTSVDALAVNAVGVAAVFTKLRDRLIDLRVGRSREERTQLTWERSAAFMASMGLEPESVLGVAPHTDPSVAPHQPVRHRELVTV